MNRVELVGRLVADPELKHTQQGIAVCRMRIAVDRPFRNQDGEKGADFINVVAWRSQAETAAKYLTKGRRVGISGRLQVRQYEKNGERREAVEVVADEVEFLDSRKAEEADLEEVPF